MTSRDICMPWHLCDYWIKTAGRYLISGGAATALHWGLMTLLMIAGLSPGTSTALGALAGALFNYVLQFHFTFRSSQAHVEAVPRYLLITLLSWCVNNALFAILHGFASQTVVRAQFLTTLCVTALNFVLYRRFVFNERHRVPKSP